MDDLLQSPELPSTYLPICKCKQHTCDMLRLCVSRYALKESVKQLQYLKYTVSIVHTLESLEASLTCFYAEMIQKVWI
jgi:uncharacterized protein (UPF0276 family)